MSSLIAKRTHMIRPFGDIRCQLSLFMKGFQLWTKRTAKAGVDLLHSNVQSLSVHHPGGFFITHSRIVVFRLLERTLYVSRKIFWNLDS